MSVEDLKKFEDRVEHLSNERMLLEALNSLKIYWFSEDSGGYGLEQRQRVLTNGIAVLSQFIFHDFCMRCSQEEPISHSHRMSANFKKIF